MGERIWLEPVDLGRNRRHAERRCNSQALMMRIKLGRDMFGPGRRPSVTGQRLAWMRSAKIFDISEPGRTPSLTPF